MNVLFLTSELAGYIKAGGLADVSAALPSALRKRGLDARVLLLFYGPGPDWIPSLRIVAQLPGLGELPPSRGNAMLNASSDKRESRRNCGEAEAAVTVTEKCGAGFPSVVTTAPLKVTPGGLGRASPASNKRVMAINARRADTHEVMCSSSHIDYHTRLCQSH